jgi:membrane associated rhomboid family serine protease
LILPIGHSEGGVRRLPWVSFAVMAICVLAFLVAKPASDFGGTERDATAAIEYYFEHPYLELDPKLAEALGGSGPQFEAMIEAVRASLPPPEDREVLAAEQAQLDRLTEQFFDALGTGTYNRWGWVPAHPSVMGFVTHMFLHAGWLHLFGNLLIFYLAAPFLEDVWGRPAFAAFFVVGGLAAALAHMVRYSDSVVPMIGASGAVSAIMGAFLVRYWHTRIRFFYLLGLVVRGTFDAPAWVMLPMWFAQQVFFGLLTDATGASGGVAHWAHVGGFAFGVGAAVAMKRFRVEERYLRSAIETRVQHTVLDNAEVERALQSHVRGSTDEALAILADAVEREPSNCDAVLAYWSVATQHERSELAAPAMVRLIESELRSGKADLALTHWTELSVRLACPPAGPDLLVRIAQLLSRNGRREEAAMTLRRVMLTAGTGMTGRFALRVARAAQDVDAALARAAARLTLRDATLEPAERAHAERIVAATGPVSRPGLARN